MRHDQLVQPQHCCQTYPSAGEAVFFAFVGVFYIRIYRNACADTYEHMHTIVYINGCRIACLSSFYYIYILFLTNVRTIFLRTRFLDGYHEKNSIFKLQNSIFFLCRLIHCHSSYIINLQTYERNKDTRSY